MIVPAVLVFSLTRGWVAGFVVFISLGTASLWLLLGVPTLLASLLAGYMLMPTLPSRPRTSRSSRLSQMTRVAEFALFGAFMPLVSLALLVVMVLPLSGIAEIAAAAVGATMALCVSVRVAHSDLRTDQRMS